MAVKDQVITDRYALYHGDCCEVMPTLPAGSVHLSVYSPPFGGLYHYSSSERDLSNCSDYRQFFEHYAFVVRELARITLPGRDHGCSLHGRAQPQHRARLSGRFPRRHHPPA